MQFYVYKINNYVQNKKLNKCFGGRSKINNFIVKKKLFLHLVTFFLTDDEEMSMEGPRAKFTV